ncbi:MAG: hypothetical protein FWE07_06360 [Turicibacter sp.]|nr:hypothetical protein [Turicibacter sp.]
MVVESGGENATATFEQGFAVEGFDLFLQQVDVAGFGQVERVARLAD